MMLLALLPVSAAARADEDPEAELPPFELRRFAEDWSEAKPEPDDATARLKNRELAPGLRLDVGGQARLRIEHLGDAGFVRGEDDTWTLWRLRLHANLRWRERLRVFVEARSSFAGDRDVAGGRRAVDSDTFDWQNAFLELRAAEGHDAPRLRIGRQELLFGKQRLVSPANWRNVRRSFDGLSASAPLAGGRLTAFAVKPVLVERYGSNEPDPETEFYGVYAALPAPLPGSELGLDLYAYFLDRDDVARNGTSGDEERLTLGGRLAGPTQLGCLDLDLEGAWQTGEIGSGDVDAFFAEAEVGCRLPRLPLQPRFFLVASWASGDERPGGDVETFDPLFPTGHAYLGYADQVGRLNLASISPGVVLRPNPRLLLRLQAHGFRRVDADDALYSPGGAVVRAPGSDGSRDVGAELDFFARYAPDRHWSLLAGWSHVFPGDFLRDGGPGEDLDFGYFAVQYTF